MGHPPTRELDTLVDIAVIFGGPSPEHDVSVLTGLQAAHELLDQGGPVLALYWSKTGEFFEVEPRP